MSSPDQWKTTKRFAKCSSLEHQSSGACTRGEAVSRFSCYRTFCNLERRKEGAFVFRYSSYLALRGAFAERLPMDKGEKEYTDA